jgi:hypothetical protein
MAETSGSWSSVSIAESSGSWSSMSTAECSGSSVSDKLDGEREPCCLRSQDSQDPLDISTQSESDEPDEETLDVLGTRFCLPGDGDAGAERYCVFFVSRRLRSTAMFGFTTDEDRSPEGSDRLKASLATLTSPFGR